MVLLTIALVITAVSTWLFVRGAVRLVGLLRRGAPSPRRLTPAGPRLGRVLAEILSHSRFTTRPIVREAHWFVMISFVILVPTLGAAYAKLLDPLAALPLIGRWIGWQWLVELSAWTGLAGIAFLFVTRLRYTPVGPDADSARDWKSRFYGSTRWQAFFVEAVIAGVLVCVLAMHACESALLLTDSSTAEQGSWVHYPTTYGLGRLWSGTSAATLGAVVTGLAFAKILISMAWLGVVGWGVTMSVAWHRFLAVVNVFARREVDGSPALGAAAPMRVDGVPFDIRAIDQISDDAAFGVTTIADFGWKSLLDFASCSECGRCQDVCPAWNTGKPLSPKLFTLALRDQTAGVHHTGDVLGALMAAKALGSAGATTWSMNLVPNLITPDVLWSCTTCGACVEACPVDIEHVDHILDLRRSEVMTKADFPAEYGSLFSALESKGNPWGLPPRNRLDWTLAMDVPVPVVGRDVASLTEMEYLLWVGCAGAYDDKGTQTTRAVADLLQRAGVSFAVLGTAETCCGDPGRRTGNEATYQSLAAQNIDTFNDLGVDKIIVTCAHCLNTLSHEYEQLGGTYRVFHHTQVLNRLIREGRLTLAAPDPAEELTPITYHDPCYLGRHQGEYDAPRDVLAALPGATLIEMDHNRRTSMCCGAGGGRMWAEDNVGERINVTRLAEATAAGATTVVTACPFCAIMLDDASAASESKPLVQDVSLMVLAAVRRADQRETPSTPHLPPEPPIDGKA